MKTFLCALACVCITASGSAATYVVGIRSPPLETRIAQQPSSVFLELGTRFSTITAARIRLKGTHRNGWWEGDQVEDSYVGPFGEQLAVFVRGGGAVSGAGGSELVYSANLAFTEAGSVTTNVVLKTRPTDFVQFEPVPTGAVSVDVWNSCCGGFGRIVVQPELEIDEIEVEVDVTPVFEVTSIISQGMLKWSALPPGGTIEVLVANSLDGPWEVAERLPSAARFTTLAHTQMESTRFIQLRWLESVSP